MLTGRGRCPNRGTPTTPTWQFGQKPIWDSRFSTSISIPPRSGTKAGTCTVHAAWREHPVMAAHGRGCTVRSWCLPPLFLRRDECRRQPTMHRSPTRMTCRNGKVTGPNVILTPVMYMIDDVHVQRPSRLHGRLDGNENSRHGGPGCICMSDTSVVID